MSVWSNGAEAMELETDILEQSIADYDRELLNILLLDRTTRQNIRWGTDNYRGYGAGYAPEDEILPGLITGSYRFVIQPRVDKSSIEQWHRTKDKAEVFTPSWVCNQQNNLVDASWFGKQNVFNQTVPGAWKTNAGKILFPFGKTWRDYIKAIRMEVSCGEAPYLVSRYDTVTGEIIPVRERIGLLDRKLRIARENTTGEDGWLFWAEKAFQSCYGYDFQGDNLVLARENLLFSLVEYMQEYFGHEPDRKTMRKFARIVSWNIWQMNGITLTVPYAKKAKYFQADLFGNDEAPALVDVPCRVYDWPANRSVLFKSLVD